MNTQTTLRPTLRDLAIEHALRAKEDGRGEWVAYEAFKVALRSSVENEDEFHEANRIYLEMTGI